MKKRRPLSRIVFFCVKAVLFICISLYALFNVYGYRLNINESAFVKTGIIEVRSVPQDVNIQLDGIQQAKKSPFEIRDVSLGKHEVCIWKEGFIPFTREVDVGGVFVVRFGKIFLIPEQADLYLSRIGRFPQEEIETEHFIIFPLPQEKRVVLFDKGSGGFLTGDVPFSLLDLMTTEERSKDGLLFLANGIVYMVSIPSFQVQRLPLEHVDEVHVDPDHPEQILYRTGGTLFMYRPDNNTHSPLASQVTSFASTATSVFYCEEKRAFVQSQSSLLSGTSQRFNLPSYLCPVDKVFEYMGKNIVLSGGMMSTPYAIIDNGISSGPLVLPGGNELYAIGGALYYTDSRGEKRNLVSRFASSITALAQGPSMAHVFVAVGNELHFCDMNNNMCQPLATFQDPVTFLFYHQQQHLLLVQSKNTLYKMSFPYWEQPWF